eukprot:NODE_303_length_10328_cov_1.228077.p2 type:complete len:499 gc:universal NODE_303_length_10328_cov_1.228077:2416-920(-)
MPKKIICRINKTWLPSYYTDSHLLDRSKQIAISSVDFKPKFTLLSGENVPYLEHNLEQVILNNRINWVHEGYSNIRKIPKISQDQVTKVQHYTPPSQDKRLISNAKRKHRFIGSTSTVTGILSQIYYLISQKRRLNVDGLSSAFQKMSTEFSRGASSPVSVLLQRQNISNGKQTIWTIDSDKSFDDDTPLSTLGHVLEFQLTMNNKEFDDLFDGSKKRDKGAYNLMDFNSLLIRSQLDCQHHSLERKFFDIKTRAVLPIRLNSKNPDIGIWYRILKLKGQYCSFEREYYDMIRAAFLKYYFQVCLGNMDGIFVAFHNTDELFGFQYISRKELSKRLFGSEEIGESVFGLCIQVMENVLEDLTSDVSSSILATFYFDRTFLSVYRYLVPKTYTKFNSRNLLDPVKHFSNGKLSLINYQAESFLNNIDFGKETKIKESASNLSTILSKSLRSTDIYEICSTYKKAKLLERQVKTSSNEKNILRLKEELVTQFDLERSAAL